MNHHLHIVCLDAPAPPNYGGAIEMYCKIKALAASGVIISLHYFDYKKERSAAGLESCCAQVFRYERKSILQSLPFSKPHIVTSRINPELIHRLNTDNDPILLEGIHSTGIIPYLKNRDRKIVVRLHNDEADYYKHLAAAEPNFFKRLYFKQESKLLKKYQKALSQDITYGALCQADANQFRNIYGLHNVFMIPAFVRWQIVTSPLGKGTYCLYHGNLSVIENEAAALWLLQHVFSQMAVPFIIAGKNISTKLKTAAAALPYVQLINDPTDETLDQLIERAHIHVLPDLNQTGVKLKLLHALVCGRFCITNHAELPESSTIALAKTPEDYMRFLKSFMERSFTEHDRIERKQTLQLYNNMANAEKIKALLL